MSVNLGSAAELERIAIEAARPQIRDVAREFRAEVRAVIYDEDAILDGDFLRSIEIEEGPDGVWYCYTGLFYGPYLEKGTGLFREGPGPKRRIFPKKGRALRFSPRKGAFAGQTIFATSIAGMKPRRIFRQAGERFTARRGSTWRSFPYR